MIPLIRSRSSGVVSSSPNFEQLAAASGGTLTTEILDEAALEALGAHSLLSVGRGSEQPSRLIVMKYQGADDPDEAQELAEAILEEKVTSDLIRAAIRRATISRSCPCPVRRRPLRRSPAIVAGSIPIAPRGRLLNGDYAGSSGTRPHPAISC